MPATKKRQRPVNFPREFRKAIDANFDGSPTAFSRACGLHQGALVHYLGGENARFPLPDAFDHILKGMPAEARPALVQAWVADMVPQTAKPYVALNTKPTDHAPAGHIRLPDSTEGALEVIRDFAAVSREVREWLEVTAKIMRGQ